MLNISKKVFKPSVPYEDKIMYMNSLELNLSFSTDNPDNALCLETCIDLLSKPGSRYLGLQFLETALQQNSEKFYYNGKWSSIVFNILKDPQADNLEKIHVCKILIIIIPYLENDDNSNPKVEFMDEIFPYLLEKIKENVEWTEEASKLVRACLKIFPSQLHSHKNSLFKVILHQATCSISSKTFEVLAECFCEIPYCTKDNNTNTIKDNWANLYNQTLATVEQVKIEILDYVTNDEEISTTLVMAGEEFIFEKDNSPDYQSLLMNKFRRFVNLSKCLAKLISVKTRYPVPVPVLPTLQCFIPLYTACKKEGAEDALHDLVCTFIVQMHLAGLSVIEALLLNSNIVKYTVAVKDFIVVAYRSSNSITSSEPVSELRVAVWKLLHIWIETLGRSASKEILLTFELITGLITDINVDTYESLQSSNSVQTQKSKKNICNSRSKSTLIRNNMLKVCEAALDTLESVIYIGSLDFSQKAFLQEICHKVFKVCQAIDSPPFPFPYSNASCREKLYSVVMAIVVVLQPGEVQSLQTAMLIINRIQHDPNFKVRKLSNRFLVTCRLQLYPKRQIPLCSDKPRQPNVSDQRLQYSEWTSEEYVQNIPAECEAETSENVNIKVEQSFENQSEVEVHSEDYMEVETDCNEQVVENQCNGEDLEIPSSSQCQDEDESEEEEEDEEDERNYGEEEVNQDERHQEIYIPATRKIVNSSVQINSETVKSITEPEYEELTAHSKIEENTLNSSSKDTCVNGDDIVMHESMSSSSIQQTVSNENGIFGVDDEDDVEEENENEEDEEEENESYLADKKMEHYDPPLKKQRIETKEDLDNDDRQEKSRSPTLEEMKADLLEILPSIEDVRSGKVQLSTS